MRKIILIILCILSFSMSYCGSYTFETEKDIQRSNNWIIPFRIAYTIDAFQTKTILSNPERWREKNPLYRGLSGEQGFVALIAANYTAERLITGIKDRKLREIVGWIAFGIEAYWVGRNFSKGITLDFKFKF